MILATTVSVDSDEYQYLRLLVNCGDMVSSALSTSNATTDTNDVNARQGTHFLLVSNDANKATVISDCFKLLRGQHEVSVDVALYSSACSSACSNTCSSYCSSDCSIVYRYMSSKACSSTYRYMSTYACNSTSRSE